MTLPSWIPAVAVALVGALLTLAVLWGKTLSSVGRMERQLDDLGKKLEKLVAHEEKLVALEKEIDRLSSVLSIVQPHHTKAAT